MNVTFFPNQYALTLSTQEMALPELRDRILKTTAASKAKLPFLKLACFGDKRSPRKKNGRGGNCLRNDDNVVEITGIELDYDGKVMPFEEAIAIVEQAKLHALLYTSANYKAEKPKWRIVLPTSCALPPPEREKHVARVNGLFGGIFADESFVLSQSYYYGAINGNPDHRAEIVEGDFIDLRSDLDAGALGKEQQPKPNGSGEAPSHIHNANAQGRGTSTNTHDIGGEPDETLITDIVNARRYYIPLLKLSARMIIRGETPEHTTQFLQGLMDASTGPRDDNWQERRNDTIAKLVASAVEKKERGEWAGKIDLEASIAAGYRSAAPAQGAAVLVRASEIVMRSKDWLWEGHLLRGAQEISTGSPGLGKSQVQCSLVACVTTKKPWPDGAPGMTEPASVIMITAEDCLDQEVVPRLIAAGADLEKVHFLKCIKTDDKQRQFLLSEDLETLKQCLAEIKDVGLITIDPITAYMGGKVDAHKVTEVRSQLGPLKDFAEENNISVSTITHPPKSSSQRAIDQFIGSQAFIAACRIGHLMIEEKDEDGIPTGRVLFTHAKHNASEKKPTLAYKQNVMTVGQDPHTQKPIIAPYVIWDEHSVPITADGAMAAASGREDTDQKKVKDFLRGILASGDPVPYKNIEEEAEQQGFTRKQLRTAKQKLGITSNKDGLGGPWMWQLKF